MKYANLSLALYATLILSSCTTTPSDQIHANKQPISDSVYNALRFDTSKYTTQTITVGERSLVVRAYENIPYVLNPVEPEYQVMNIYIPESYFHGKSINGYTAHTAPIFFPNGVGGYMPAKPLTASQQGIGGETRPNSVAEALLHGYVVASAGARGRTLQSNGVYTGKAPAAIVDLKAAVRYLKFNDTLMAGDANKIISNGTSAGGALSALLGASGDHTDYLPALQQAGAIMNASDAVFATSAYCPITNLENADMAYEWQFYGVNDYQAMSITMLDYHMERTYTNKHLTDVQQGYSAKLKTMFPNYINTLGLIGHDGKILTLDNEGNGSFKDEVRYYLNQSVNAAHQQGVDLSAYDFLAQRKSPSPYYIENYDGFIRHYVGRKKGVPAFDDVSLGSGENNLFGDSTMDNRHFTAFGQENSTANATKADAQTIKMMNAMNYTATTPTQHWRIRHGTKDADTSFAVPVILATSLKNHGKSVDFAMPWDKVHSGDYDLAELFTWVDKVAKGQ